MTDRLRLWLRATRPFSFTASVIPVLVGTLLGFAEAVHPVRFVLALAGAVASHAGTNLVNDYFDHVKGADGPHSLGPSGVIQQGLITPRAVLRAGLLAFAAGAALGLVLVALAGPSLLWLGLASLAAGFLYTGGPAAFAYIGLGEVVVFVFMGPVMVMGAYYVQTERWGWTPLLVSLPVAFLVAAILHANNMRDIDDDRRTGKRTLATLVGPRWASYEYYVLVGGAYLALVALVAAGIAPWPALVALLTAPMALRVVRLVRSITTARGLNIVLRSTALLHLRFGILLTLALAGTLAL